MGTRGAALATVIAQALQAVALFLPFIARQSRHHFGTGRWQLRPAVLWDCLRIGTPNAIGHMIEISAWATLAVMVIHLDKAYATALTIGQSLFVLTSFALDGLQKGVTTIAANFIGGQQWPLIRRLAMAGLSLDLLLAAVLAIPLLAFPDTLLHLLAGNDVDRQYIDSIKDILYLIFFAMWLYFIFDCLTWILAGILTGAGDTKFVMIIDAVNAWLVAILPIYYLVYRHHGRPEWIWYGFVAYGIVNASCFYLRYRSNRWRSININAAAASYAQEAFSEQSSPQQGNPSIITRER